MLKRGFTVHQGAVAGGRTWSAPPAGGDRTFPSSDSASSLLKKAERVLAAFDCAHPQLSLTEVIRRSGLSRSSTHRILDQLVQLHWLDREGRNYRLGIRLVEHGGRAAQHNRLLRAAVPRLDRLHEATGKMVQLHVLDGMDVVCHDRVGTLDDHSVATHIGARLPAHCTAAGKALLGFGDPADVKRVLEAGLQPLTPHTVTRPFLFRTELALVRKEGVAFDWEGSCQGLVAAAAPLRGAGRAIAAVSLSSWGGHRTIERLAPLLQSCVRSIWSELYGLGRAARFTPLEAPPATVPVPMDSMNRWARSNNWM
ncbi:IclR family transcriptional regulator [Streptomyces sp. NPDC050145]|uniref:IclR family transcriptional regulator n=1 Tax=Streptomyces sp. NPDC050145 TaxID=3365602 RepID=UPI0037BB1CD7